MTWRERPICLDCQRTIHGPGTGPVGPTPSSSEHPWLELASDYPPDTPQCVLCYRLASPAASMRLWQDEPESPPPLEAA